MLGRMLASSTITAVQQCKEDAMAMTLHKHLLSAVLRKEEDLYVAARSEVGVFRQGYSVEAAIANLKEATELNLEEFPSNRVSRCD